MADGAMQFSGPMVRALLREVAHPGTGKRQTRRPIEPYTGGNLRTGDILVSWPANEFMRKGASFRPRFLQGDRLRVRETWRAEARWDDVPPRLIAKGSPIYFEAGGGGEEAIPECAGKLRPGRFMNRWASRLTLYVTDVRVQRVQDISESDALAEGILFDESLPEDVHRYWLDLGNDSKGAEWITSWDARDVYRQLWHHLHGAGSWEANPWVAAYTFMPVLANIDSLPATVGEAA